jgi:DNA-binding HxlR family transcriptional regulator
MSKIKETSSNFANKSALSDECPEVYAAQLISGQWSLAICSWLLLGKLRFSELKNRLPNITERMLALQLRKLEDNGIIARTIYATVPARVDYELTAIGYELKPIIKQLEAWGEKHRLLSTQDKRDLA